jgi:hypothetical protein
MKNTMLIILLSSLMLTIISISSVELAVGNPTTFSYVGPSTPDTSLPKITITLPENGAIYNTKDISYSLTVQKPSSWFNYGSYNGQLFSVEYYLDSNPKVTIAEKEFDSLQSLNSKDPITLQGTLTGLSEGSHTFQVFVYGVSYYQDAHQAQGVPSNYYMNNNSTVSFTIDTVSPTITPTQSFPTPSNSNINDRADFPLTYALAIVAVAIFAIVIGALLLYRSHRKTAKHS